MPKKTHSSLHKGVQNDEMRFVVKVSKTTNVKLISADATTEGEVTMGSVNDLLAPQSHIRGIKVVISDHWYGSNGKHGVSLHAKSILFEKNLVAAQADDFSDML